MSQYVHFPKCQTLILASSPQGWKDAVCFSCFFFSLSYRLYTVHQTRLANYVPRIGSFLLFFFKLLIQAVPRGSFALSYLGANGREENNGPARFDATETENVIYMNVKDARNYVWATGAAAHNEYIEWSLYSQPVQGQGGQRMEMSLLEAFFFSSNIVGSLELVSGNHWGYCLCSKEQWMQALHFFFF